MKLSLPLLLLTIVACGSVAPAPVGSPLSLPQLKFAVMDSAGKPAAFEPQAIPAVVFTDPEIAWAGLTVEEAADTLGYDVGK